MNFEKQLIKRYESAINGQLNQLQSKKNYFQTYVDKLTALGITLNENDLELLFENPKSFITDKLTAGEEMQVGGLKLNKEKLFDLIEKPTGTNALIENIETDLLNRGILENNIWQVKNFSIKDNQVIVNPKHLEEINEQHSLFIENENQQKGFEKLQQIVILVNEINQLEGQSISLETELSDLMEGRNFIYELKPENVKRFK